MHGKDQIYNCSRNLLATREVTTPSSAGVKPKLDLGTFSSSFSAESLTMVSKYWCSATYHIAEWFIRLSLDGGVDNFLNSLGKLVLFNVLLYRHRYRPSCPLIGSTCCQNTPLLPEPQSVDGHFWRKPCLGFMIMSNGSAAHGSLAPVLRNKSTIGADLA